MATNLSLSNNQFFNGTEEGGERNKDIIESTFSLHN
jgi:hypothetical protein